MRVLLCGLFRFLHLCQDYVERNSLSLTTIYLFDMFSLYGIEGEWTSCSEGRMRSFLLLFIQLLYSFPSPANACACDKTCGKLVSMRLIYVASIWLQCKRDPYYRALAHQRASVTISMSQDDIIGDASCSELGHEMSVKLIFVYWENRRRLIQPCMLILFSVSIVLFFSLISIRIFL